MAGANLLFLIQFLQAKAKPKSLEADERQENSRIYNFLVWLEGRVLGLEKRVTTLEAAPAAAGGDSLILNPSELAGRGSLSGIGEHEAITLGANLSMAGTVLSASGGAGALTIGNVQVNFGAAPGTNIATATVTGQAGILATSFIQAFIRGGIVTTNHNTYEHVLFPGFVRIDNIIAGVGFTIYAVATEQRVSGRFNTQWMWSN